MKRFSIGSAVLVLFIFLTGFAQEAAYQNPDAVMLRFPDVSDTHIVFSYAGDLWLVAREGGIARRLSSPPGQELFPKFSPDGNWIAFSGNYDGDTDVYLMPAEGGAPTRLTHHPAVDLVVDWFPDGKHVLFRSRMMSPSRRFNQLFKQSVEGGLPEKLPLSYGELASFNAEGTRMAFQFVSRQFRHWKRYRGGWASDLWLFDFQRDTSWQITTFPGTDALPMWHGKTIYFLSDRDENSKLNIWAYDLDSKTFRQVTYFTEFDVKWPSLGPKEIVFQNGGQLYLLDLATEKAAPVDIRVPADLPRVRPQFKKVAKYIVNASLSPAGKRALFEARGEIFSVPAKHGSIRNLTHTSGVAERFPVWSPDGKYVAYFSDQTGEYELYLRDSESGAVRQVTRGGRAFRYSPRWSPDSKYIAFSDKTGSLFVVEAESGKISKVDKDDWSELHQYSWSPDSRWLAYAKNAENRMGMIMVYEVETGQTHQLTSDFYDDSQPVFDPEGKYLYYFSDRHFQPVYGDMDATWVYPNSTELFAVPLTREIQSPLAPRNDEVSLGEEKAEPEKKEKEKKTAKQEEGVPPVRIDFEGFEKRAVKLPVDAGNFGRLAAVKGKVLFTRYPAAGAAKPGKPAGTLKYYDLKEREIKTVMAGIDDFTISADGKKVGYRSKGTYGIVDLKEGQKVGDGKLATEKMQVWINPREEWRQIFWEAWRIERDYFYDPGMHGLDWKAVGERYAKLLPFVSSRADLNYVIGEMIGELNASHTYVRGGDLEHAKEIPVGLLGCDFELDRTNRAYRIKKIYRGASWDVKVRSPLLEPGINLQEGEYLLAVNGQPLDVRLDPWAAFQGLAGEVVELTVNTTPDLKTARKVLVKPLKSEFRLRYLEWVENNRRQVEIATAGRVGYIYVPNTGIDGQNELVRQFLPQRTKDALIIDERFNSGGQIPDRFVELFNRPIYNYWARRDFRSWQTPFVAHNGPKVMLINQWSGSGGDAFPYYFKKAGLGPLIGKRTWGGLIGISGNPTLIDGGSVTAPTFGFWNTEGKWDVEGYGVEPDYDLENAPHELARGHDQQLEKAIQVVLELLKVHPPSKLTKPAYPDKTGPSFLPK